MRIEEAKAADVQKIFDSISDAVIATDAQYRITYWNKAAEEIYGYTSEEMLGKVMSEVIAIEYVNTTREQIIEQALATGYWKGEVIQETKSGEKVHIEASSRMLYDDKREVTGVVAVNRDINDHKALETFKTMLDEMSPNKGNGRTFSQKYHENLYQNLASVRILFMSLITNQVYNSDKQTDIIRRIIEEVDELMDQSKKLM